MIQKEKYRPETTWRIVLLPPATYQKQQDSSSQGAIQAGATEFYPAVSDN
jgi:hypothetical protein